MDIYIPQLNPVAVTITMGRREVRIGPYPTSEKGGEAATHLRRYAQRHLPNTPVEVVLTGYNPDIAHLVAELPTGRDLLGPLLATEPRAWPDVHARLAAWHGELEAARIYTAALHWNEQKRRVAATRR